MSYLGALCSCLSFIFFTEVSNPRRYDDYDDDDACSNSRRRRQRNKKTALEHLLITTDERRMALESLLLPLSVVLPGVAAGENMSVAAKEETNNSNNNNDSNKLFPLAICTDDPGVFDTTLTQELVLTQHALRLPASRLQELVYQSLEYAFCSEKTKSVIRHQWQQHHHHCRGGQEQEANYAAIVKQGY
mmetsp:Transcript_20040/g.55307  ORF Transcript_20040/g.55307 Transcript_20040/m.55307 type:complete len:189 (-) Transcript_20040:2159-2725(-)